MDHAFSEELSITQSGGGGDNWGYLVREIALGGVASEDWREDSIGYNTQCLLVVGKGVKQR